MLAGFGVVQGSKLGDGLDVADGVLEVRQVVHLRCLPHSAGWAADLADERNADECDRERDRQAATADEEVPLAVVGDGHRLLS
jgi:hypothetical protein